MKKLFIKIILWLVMANGFVAFGFALNTQKSLWLPEYGQSFWWAWGAAFSEAPETILFVSFGIIAFVFIQLKSRKDSKTK